VQNDRSAFGKPAKEVRPIAIADFTPTSESTLDVEPRGPRKSRPRQPQHPS
jgi:hypothetical protein